MEVNPVKRSKYICLRQNLRRFWWAWLPIVVLLLWCKGDLVRATTREYELEGHREADEVVVWAYMRRQPAADEWRPSRIFKYAVQDSGDWNLVLNIEDPQSRYVAAEFHSILLTDSDYDWEQSIRDEEQMPMTLSFRRASRETGSSGRSIFHVFGSRGGAEGMAIYDIPIPDRTGVVVAHIAVTLESNEGELHTSDWQLPMRFVEKNTYTSDALAYVFGST